MLFINWREIPFIRLIIPFMLGIWLSIQVGENLPFPIVLLGSFTLISFGFLRIKMEVYRKWLIGIWLNVVLFLFAWQLTYWNNPTTHETHYEQIINHKNNSKYWIIGKVVNIPTTKKTTKIELKLEQIGTHQDSLVPATGKLLCYVQADSLSDGLEYGQRIFFQSFVNEVESPKNPNQFNYKQFLSYQKIYHQSYLPSGNWSVLESNETSLLSWISDIRSKRIQQIKTYVKGEAEQGVAMALLLGFKEELSEDVKAAYSETGAIHVLAVSGLHVGIIAMILRFILNFFYWKKRKWLKLLLMILPLWFYALLTGFSPSVIRATVMFSLLVAGLETDKASNIYNILAASALVLLLFEPYFLFSVGFQLSYAAVFGIVYFQPRIAIWWQPSSKIVDYFWQLTTVSIAATLGTLPFTLYYFHQFPIWFWLSSAIVIPAAFLILSLGLMFFTFGLIRGFDVFLGTALHWTIYAMNWCIKAIHHFPVSIIKGLWFSEMEFYVLLFSILTFGFLLQTRQIRWSLYSLGLIGILTLTSFVSNWQTKQQQQLVMYSLSNQTAIDFINGQNVTTLQSENFNHKAYQFAAQSHHWKLNIKTVDSILISENITQPNLIKKGNLIQWNEMKFLIIDDKIKLINDKITIDYLILRNNPKVSIEDLKHNFTFKKVIFDGSNKYWKIKNWKTECKSLNVAFEDVRNDAAFVL